MCLDCQIQLGKASLGK